MVDSREPLLAARHLTMLGLIPRAPRKISAPELCTKLDEHGFAVDLRSVQRDLNNLSHKFALCSDHKKPAGWSYAAGARPPVTPALDRSDSLTLYMVERYLSPMLPRALLRDLQPRFEEARHILGHDHAEGGWSKRVATISSGPPLLAPDVANDVLQAVHESLLKRVQLEVDYRAAGASRWKSVVLNPLGLVNRDGVFYLVATAWGYNEPRQWALHRVRNPKRRQDAAREPDGFDLGRYIKDERGFDWPIGKRIRVRLRLRPDVAPFLEERPLSTDQKLLRSKDGGVNLTATVQDSMQLRWWMLGYGAGIEVRGPKALRTWMKEQACALANAYRRR